MKEIQIISILIALLVFPVLCLGGRSKYPSLRPSRDYWDRNARKVPVQISHLSPNRRLAAVGDTLYMLNARNRIVWTWSTEGPPLTDLPVVDSNGIVYVIGFDLIWAALDSATGKEKWRGTSNGRAVYSQIELYKKDRYFVVTSMEGYRDSLSDRTIPDELTLCRGNAILWETDIPKGTKIEVRGNKVFGVIRRKNQIRRREIIVPRNLGKPIGKVSIWADY